MDTEMQTNRIIITVEQLFRGYQDNDWDGVVGYDGKLNIRPQYQRELVYAEDKQRKVIDTILKRRPLNIMYWVENDDGTFELLDGQQRTLSICRFLDHKFVIFDSNNEKAYFDTLSREEQEKILQYPLDICICKGPEKEILNWFRTVNISGLALNNQEMLNASYSGVWATDARRYFSRPKQCAAHTLAKDYLSGSVERQDYLAKVLKWISNGDVEGYMAAHRHDDNADELWAYFEDVITWVKKVFPVYRFEMKGLDWGKFYNELHNKTFNSEELERKIQSLLADSEVQSKSGIYEYVLYGSEKVLHLRAFDKDIKRTVYEQQQGHCPYCDKEIDGTHIGHQYPIEEMEADHIIPWSKGGKTTIENCQVLCDKHNLLKSNHLL